MQGETSYGNEPILTESRNCKESLTSCFGCARTSAFFQVFGGFFSSTEPNVSAKIKTVQLCPPQVNI